MKRLFLAVISLASAMLCIVFGSSVVSAAETDSLEYVIQKGSIYYESASAFGTGRRGVVCEDNPYTVNPCYAGINGYAYLDEKGRVLLSEYDESTTDIDIPPAPEGTFKLYKHFRTANYRNGWVDSNCVMKVPEKTEETLEFSEDTPVEPEKVVDKISQDVKKDMKTCIVIDYSGSMADNQREVVNLLGSIQFNDNTTIIVFADTFEIVTHEELTNEDFYVGGATHMYQAINGALELGTEQLIIISDLQTYADEKLMAASDTIRKVTIYDPDEDEFDSYVLDELKEKLGNLTRIIIK